MTSIGKDGEQRQYGAPSHLLSSRRHPAGGSGHRFARSYNPRWGLARQSEPYHSEETQHWKHFTYDKLDRLVRTTNPDGTASTISYAPGADSTAELLVTTLTDEAGHRLIEAADSGGQRVRRSRMKDAEPVTTRYQRDGLGRIIRITDPAGNQWTYTYDGLGRRTAVNDPDLGVWSYAYDNASRLTTQRDAKGQVTELNYDALSRLTSKLVRGTDGQEITTNSYDQARSGYFNLGQLTSAVRTAGNRTFTPDASPPQRQLLSTAVSYSEPDVLPRFGRPRDYRQLQKFV